MSVGTAALTRESPPPVGVLQRDVVFTEYTPLSGSLEVARRTLSPLANIEITKAIEKAPLRAQAIDLERERFSVYVPVKQPPPGFGLLSFIPPWQAPRLPPGGAAGLEDNGVIF